MKRYLLLFLVSTTPLFVIGQNQTAIQSATVTFVYVSNDVDGSIAGFESDATIDLEDLTQSKFKGSVSVKSLKTGNSIRDWSLRRGKYFDADNYPKIRFESTSVMANGSGFIVKGELTIKATTKPFTIDFTKNGKQLTGAATLYSSDFGINVKKKKEDNKVRVKMVFVLK